MITISEKIIEVTKIIPGENYVTVFCDIPEFTAIQSQLEIGESLATRDITLNFNGCGETRWKIFFFPKGQYYCGVPSKDLRVYIQPVSFNDATLKMSIQVTLTGKSFPNDNGDTVSSCPCEGIFQRDNPVQNWTGPFRFEYKAVIKPSTNFVTVKCFFRLIVDESNVSKPYKRSFIGDESPTRDDSPEPMKKRRSTGSTPSTSTAARETDQNIGTRGHSAMEFDDEFVNSSNRNKSKSSKNVDVDPFMTNLTYSKQFNASFDISPPDPFNTKSPLLYNRLTQAPNGNSAEKLVNRDRGNFQFKKPSPRTIIFTPEERENLKQSPTSRRKLSLSFSRSDNVKHQNVQSKQFKSSGYLKVSDIDRAEKADPDKQSAQSGLETSLSDPNSVMTSAEDVSTDKTTLRELICSNNKRF